jgi:hypothetical protein
LIAPRTRSRRLSATRKSQSLEHIEMDKNAEEIFKAMALENQTIGNELIRISNLSFETLSLYTVI